MRDTRDSADPPRVNYTINCTIISATAQLQADVIARRNRAFNRARHRARARVR